MFEQKRPSACAVILLLASLVVAGQVEAGFFGNIFCRDTSDKSYVKLANELHKATPSSEPKDNLAEAIKLHGAFDYMKESPIYSKLLTRFVSMMSRDTNEERQLCEDFRMGTLRLFAEAMADQGNLAPGKMTEPIRRLNQIIIKQVLKARRTCFDYLAKQWPSPWKTAEGWPDVYKHLGKLDKLPRSKLLDSQPKFESLELAHFEGILNFACPLYDEVRMVLKPYVDLLMAAHIVDPESNKMAKFYEDPRERVVELAQERGEIDHPNSEFINEVYRFRACEMLASEREKNEKCN